MTSEILKKAELWKEKATMDPALREELFRMSEEELSDAFYRDLTFGTAGLRGVLGAGTNRMNVYTVGAASQGLSNYVKKHYPKEAQRIALSRDSRINSELFTRVAASVFAANGIQVYVYPELMPTPCLSFAVRYLHCAAGVMVTASHNPAKYNGYKVYGADGAQMTEEGANEVFSEIQKLSVFSDILWGDYEALCEKGQIEILGKETEDAYVKEVRAQSLLPKEATVSRDVKIVYTPLYGAGRKPVMRVLSEEGFHKVILCKEQAEPDGHFPTCPYPNPELYETMSLGMETAEREEADLLFATDPDADRTAVAVKTPGGTYEILSGNELGCLLLDYVSLMRKKAQKMPENPVAVKSVVSTDLAAKIARIHGVEMRNVLTGFKYIGDQIALLEEKGEAERFIFGFEESCGYLAGTYCRDKDAVVTSLLVAEMFAYYQSQGSNLYTRMQEIYAELGFFKSASHSFEYQGQEGAEKMKQIMEAFRKPTEKIGGLAVLETVDYEKGVDGLPKADVVKFVLEDEASVVIRPSGTEPKIKVYVTVRGASGADAALKEEALFAALKPAFA